MPYPLLSLEILGLQVEVHPGDHDGNLNRVRELLTEIRPETRTILVLPEMWLDGFVFPNPSQQAASYQTALKSLSKILPPGCLLLSTGLTEESGVFFNTLTALSPKGTVGLYRKGHLFPESEEAKILSPGDDLSLFSFQSILFGGLICFDLRFPRSFQSLAAAGAVGVIIPSQWPPSRIDHWRTLLAARAIENQFFVIGLNAAAGADNPMAGGYSAAFDPWGNEITSLGPHPGILRVRIDPGQVQQIRSRHPYVNCRRPSLDGGDQEISVTKL